MKKIAIHCYLKSLSYNYINENRDLCSYACTDVLQPSFIFPSRLVLVLRSFRQTRFPRVPFRSCVIPLTNVHFSNLILPKMVYNCDIANCHSVSNKSSGVSFHSLPSSQKLSDEWQDIINANEGWKRTKKIRNHDNTRVCSKHFAAHFLTDVNVGSKSMKRLSPTARPSIFPTVPTSMPQRGETQNIFGNKFKCISFMNKDYKFVTQSTHHCAILQLTTRTTPTRKQKKVLHSRKGRDSILVGFSFQQ